MDERPLQVQLNWNQDDREGRFLLRNLDEKPWVSQNSRWFWIALWGGGCF